MKKKGLSAFAVLLFVLLLAVPATAWQGRMAGAGDATGLIEDESDFLIHPAAIASGKGFNAYGTYRLTYEKTTQWDYTMNVTMPNWTFPYSADGYAWKNQAQAGAAFQLGTGRMGVFFEYDRSRGQYDGQQFWRMDSNWYNCFELENQNDNIRFRLLYGVPVAKAVNIGGELQIAYVKEENRTQMLWPAGDGSGENFPWAAEDMPWNVNFPYMIPYKSKYWEAQGKVSVDGKAGGVKYAVTLKAGLPFASDNTYTHSYDTVADTERSGKVKGFNVGGDAWLRIPLSTTVALPFVVGASYKEIKRDGDGMDLWEGDSNSYQHDEKSLSAKIGGGVDFTPAKGTKFAAGLYYNYMTSKQNVSFSEVGSDSYVFDDYSDMPNYREHRLSFNALLEQEINPSLTLRGGINGFYGFVKNNYAYSAYQSWWGENMPLDVSTNGANIGVNASVGATVKLGSVNLEPFVNGGVAKYETNGSGLYGWGPATLAFSKLNWQVGGGLSIRF